MTTQTAFTNSDFQVPIDVGDLSGVGVTNIDFTYTYDPAVLTPVFMMGSQVSTTQTGTISAGAASVAVEVSSGTIQVSISSMAPLAGSGTLIYINMHAVGAAGSMTSLALSSASFFNGVTICATPVNGQVSVIKRPTISTLQTTANPSVYGNAVTLTAHVAASPNVNGGTVNFYEGGTCGMPGLPLSGPTALNGTFDAVYMTSALSAGSHTIVACYGGTADYDASEASLMQDVNTRTLDITADDRSKTYGDTLAITGSEFTTGIGQLVNGDMVTGTMLASLGAPDTAAIGPYAITVSGATGTGLGNYNIVYHAGTLMVNAKQLDITANDQSKQYGSTFTFTGTEFTTGIGQLVNGDMVTGAMLASLGAPATAAIGPYPITVSGATGTGLGNYNIVYHAGTLMVNAKQLDITANDQSKLYGSAFTFTGTEFTTGIGQLVNGDMVTGTMLASLGAPATAAIGPYSITVSGASGTGLGNYNIVYHAGTLMVNAKQLDITANDQSKLYGSTFTFAGTEFTTGIGQLVNGDMATGAAITSTGAAAGADVGMHTIEISSATGSGLGNYAISYHNGIMTVFAGEITGNVEYAIVAKPVPGVVLTAPGTLPTPTVTATSDSLGDYTLSGFGSGPYTVTPTRTTQPCGIFAPNGIFANDAGLISQHVVGLITLTPDQIVAAKVSGPLTTMLSSFDAALIAQKVVGICNPINMAGVWMFSPGSVSHPGRPERQL